jgi:HEAT repeat protein
LEALKARVHDAEILEAMMEVARADQNPAVRMKALEGLREVAAEEDVREALLAALDHDVNPGVRVEAVNLLVRSLEMKTPRAPQAPDASDEDTDGAIVAPAAPAVTLSLADPSVRRVMKALEELQQHDPNRYVRLRSAAALRQLGTPEEQ